VAKKIYIGVWEDRHADTSVHPFELFEDAEKWARAQLAGFDLFNLEESVLSQAMIREGWRLRFTYGESDSLTIVEADLAPAGTCE